MLGQLEVKYIYIFVCCTNKFLACASSVTNNMRKTIRTTAQIGCTYRILLYIYYIYYVPVKRMFFDILFIVI